jgi:hypothetical protein
MALKYKKSGFYFKIIEIITLLLRFNNELNIFVFNKSVICQH